MRRSIEKRISNLDRVDGYHDWRGAGAIGTDVETLVEDISNDALRRDPRRAAQLLEQVVDQQHALFEMVDDSDGEVGDALRQVVETWGRAWASVDDRDAETVAELVFDAFFENDYGVLDEVIPAFAQALGSDGLAVLEARFRKALGQAPEAADDDEDRSRDWNRRMLYRGLEEIADAKGDVDGFIAAHEEAGTHLIYVVEIAERLHCAGRAAEALRWLEHPDRRQRFGDDATDLHVAVLEALRRHDEAREMIWRAFERTLWFEKFQAYLDRTPAPEREDARRRAVEVSLASENIHHALRFLIEAGALAEAEDLVLRRSTDLHSRDYGTLRPAAKALTDDHPAGAILLYRLLTEAVLRAGKSQYYRYAIGDLRQATLLAEGGVDWKEIEDHDSFMARLHDQHGRKWSFWKQW